MSEVIDSTSSPRETVSVLTQWLVLGGVVGLVCGAASAAFLLLLDEATRFREAHATIVFLLPVAALGIGWVYERLGASVKAGNNLVIDTIHDDLPEIPLRMAPLVLFGTVLTHLFGGSAGREGTAVQMGASLTDWLAHRFRIAKATRLQLLAAGVAGGFGSVFGTPIAGMIFGLEFVVLGRLEYTALLPCLAAAVVGDMTTRWLGVTHTIYPAAPFMSVSAHSLFACAVLAIAAAATSTIFIELTHALKRYGERLRLPLRMGIGGALVVVLWQLVGTSDYLGLGVPTILRAFVDPELPSYTFALKLLFTAVTLGAGFLGGEVTPLFFVGAALGSVLARWTGMPIALGAGLGMAAVFAASANTPLALSVMTVELLGANALPHVVIVCVLAYLMVGHRGIYTAQRVARRKYGHLLARPLPLREL